MPSLSFEKSKEATAIAVVRGGDLDGNVLYLHTDDKPSSIKKEVQAHKYMKELNFVKPQERVKLMNQIVEGIEKDLDADAIIGLPSKAKDIYKRIKTETANDKTIRIPDDCTFQPIPSPDPKKREIYYIAGASGSGKSFFARGIAENYKKLYPDREIYLISKLNSDTTLDTMKVGKPKRINIETFLTDPLDLDECKNCLIICDDWDTITPKPLYEAIHKLIEDICIMGY
jgi:polynucleotide 5'-kinase involved in rRNA processing